MSGPMGVSIIVVNYNNERFLAAAIDSALGQNHLPCETIVVDDFSTDHSREIIASYGERVKAVLRESNGHQIAALNGAWPLARYPILIFLDSDDLLLCHAAATVAQFWTTETMKVQFPLLTIDGAGIQLGHMAPKYPPNLTTATIRTELLRTGGSPNSPASGNAYSRSLLDRISLDGGFEFENSREHWMDAVLECNAPFYGEVVTLHEPLGCYRIHDSNLYAFNTISAARFAAKAHTFELKVNYLAGRCRSWGIPFDRAAALEGATWLHECRLCAAKLSNGKAELVPFTLRGATKACIRAQLPFVNRVLRISWFIGVAPAPRFLAKQLIALRFAPSQRPVWFENLLIKLSKISILPGSGARPRH